VNQQLPASALVSLCGFFLLSKEEKLNAENWGMSIASIWDILDPPKFVDL
jgi:hypothetical protein